MRTLVALCALAAASPAPAGAERTKGVPERKAAARQDAEGRGRGPGVPTRGNWKKIGEVRVRSGKLGLADALTPLDVDFSYPCAPGVYGVYLRTEEVGGRPYVVGAQVARHFPCARGRVTRSVPIDHGHLGVFDYADAEKVIGSLSDERGDQISDLLWDIEGSRMVEWGEEAGQLTMAVTSSGYGDGIYPAFELVRKGEACGYEVVFLEEDELE